MTEPNGNELADLQAKLDLMKQIQELQIQLGMAPATLTPSVPTAVVPAIHNNAVKNVKVPEGRYNMSLAEFRTYSNDCHAYRTLTKYEDAQIVLQLRLNMDAELKRAIDTNYMDWNSRTVEEAVEIVGKIVNQISNPAVYRKEFDSMLQNENETIREFVTRLRGCAIDCSFTCPFDDTHDLTDYHLVNRIRSGILDKTLQQEILQKQTELNNITSLVQYCEDFESAKLDRKKLNSAEGFNSNINNIQKFANESDVSESEIVAAVSAYRHLKKSGINNPEKYNQKSGIHNPEQKSRKKCGYCGYQHPKGKCPAYGQNCLKCGGSGHFSRVCRNVDTNTEGTMNANIIINALTCNALNQSDSLPRVDILIGEGFVKTPRVIKAIPDTGAEVSVAGVALLTSLGIKKKNLCTPRHNIRHVAGEKIDVLGSCKLSFKLNSIKILEDVYFIDNIQNMFLSFQACKKLMIIHNDFPNGITKQQNISTDDEANYPKVEYPKKPVKLPFNPTEENIDKLKSWLVDNFKESVFREEKPLSVMTGKDHHIHLKNQDVEPFAVGSPIPLPHHWRDEVEQLLKSHVDMGIITPVEVGEPVDWCTRMITVAKKDGSPRVTADFQELNKHIKRETHHTSYPFNIVNKIPMHFV